jgi:phage terminase large subunit
MNSPESFQKNVEIRLELPQRFKFLLEPHPYKVAWGGRNGLKSWSFADAIVALGARNKLRVVCGRNVMRSLADSVHATLSDRIKAMNIEGFYRIMESEIRGGNGTEISYAGLSNQTKESIKSFEGVDIFWVEEAQVVPEPVWAILLPTLRAVNSECWISMNPDMEDDASYQRWIVNPPPGTVSVRTGFEYAKECGYFTQKMEELRLDDQRLRPETYDNIWLGKPRTTVVGAIYSREVAEMIETGRYRPTPYDPRLPVHTVWDLGWNDSMVIIMVQKPVPTVINVINYMEDDHLRYDEFVSEMKALRYNWGTDWLPHDASQTHPETGLSAKLTLERLNRNCRLIDDGRTPDVEAGIRSARMLFPRVYVDNTKRNVARGHLGPARLMECLKRYRRNVPKTTGEPQTPVHDQYCHGADAWRGLAMVADRIRNENETTRRVIQPYRNPDSGMGVLG